MATIKKIENKKGISYKIEVFIGRDALGKKIIKSSTYWPQAKTESKRNKEVELFALEFESKVKNGELYDDGKKNFEEFAYVWLEDIKSRCTHGTASSYSMMLKNNIIPFFKGKKLTEINRYQVESFYKSMADDYAPASIKKCDIILRGIFKTAKHWDMIKDNPCVGARLPKTKKKPAELKYFTPEQAKAFLKSLDMEFEKEYKGHTRIDDTGRPYNVPNYVQMKKVPTQFKVFYNLALFCGLRRSELLALNWEDINFDERTVSVTKSVEPVKGGLAVKEPKTKTSIRTISIPSEIMPLLKQYKSEYNELKLSLGSKWRGDGNIFIQADGKRMGLHTAYHRLQKHIEAYNALIESRNSASEKEQKLEPLPIIPLHGLRHSCATLLNYMGENLIEIASVLGHAQTSTTMNIYTHSSFAKVNTSPSDKMDAFLRMKA